jgi:hypothetical protein
MVVNNGSIAFNHTVHGEVAAIPRIGDLSVFERLDSSLYSIDGCTAVFQDQHSQLCGTALRSVTVLTSITNVDILITCFEVYLLVLVTVVAGACVYVDTAHIVAGRTTRGFSCVRVDRVRAVESRVLV